LPNSQPDKNDNQQSDLAQQPLDINQLREILDSSYDEIFVIDGKGKVVYVNEACYRNYGLTPKEILGQSVDQLISDGYYSPGLAPIIFKEKKRTTFEQQTVLGKKLVVTATPILNDAGDIAFVVMNSRDITEIEDLKTNLEETKARVSAYKNELEALRQNCSESTRFVSRSKSMKECLELAQRVAKSDSTILILGETGTGKTALARYIHDVSRRKEGPFQTINCAAIPEQLLESELFGYQSGAFTGASAKGKVGLFELANEGTLFLDEIAEMPVRLQAKILEVIQESRFIPVGGTKAKTVNIRIIAATNRDLEEQVRQGTFRQDLYYRLNVIELEIAPLRERLEDIVPLSQYFLERFDKRYDTSHYFSQSTLDILIGYQWPGNVRELEHIIERLVLTVPEPKIQSKHLPKKFQQPDNQNWVHSLPALVPLDVIEEELILKAYHQLGSSYKVAAALNISQSKAHRKIKEFLEKEKGNA